MTGIIQTKRGTYIFRDDHGYEGIWAWEIHDTTGHPTTHKWHKLPKGNVILFDLDDPPLTVSYLPILE